MPLVSRPFGDIITFTRASTGTFIGADGVLQTAAVNAPRLDFDPVTLAARGFLIEDQRTNFIRAGSFSGAVAPNFPLGMGVASAGGLTTTVLGYGVDNGLPFMDFRIEGTNASNGVYAITLDSTVATGAAVGASVTLSAYCRLIAGSLTGITEVGLQLIETGGPSTLTPMAVTQPTLHQSRGSVTRLVAANPGMEPRLMMQLSGTPQTVSATFRVAAAQLEVGPFATSYIPTTGAQATRAGDLASVNTLSPWYNLSEGTMLVEFVRAGINAASTADTGFAALFESSSNFVSLQASFSVPPNQVLSIWNGGVEQTLIVQFGNTTNTLYRMGAGWAANNVAFAQNGVLVGTDTTATIPTVTQLLLGRRSLTGHQLNGWLRRFQYFPRRLSNAEIQALTAI